MTTDRWRRIEEAFQTAADLSGPDREDYLRRVCAGDSQLLAEVRALLKSDEQAHGFVQQHVDEGVMSLETVEAPTKVRRAGPYVLTRELGRGGMGTVYLGERADGEYEGEVAVKLLRRGMDTEFFLARFKRERQALALLQHPNIARLLDSGATAEGSPYIVMERVDGRPITAYCREERLSVPAILRLYIQVCRAVSHAHRHFVVHRDLKPGNILVDASGSPKLLDFGICKLLAGETASGETLETTYMMTPDYASPEQVRGDSITISSDIYSLGAVLYELLTGARPHAIEKYTAQHVAIAVCEREAMLPSQAAGKDRGRELIGDLDIILQKALQKDPARRYESVDQFAEDLRRALEHEPVLARPDTTFYRVRKFTQRHTTGTVAATLAVIALTGTLIAYARQASVARRESAEARKLANAMMFDIHDRIRDLPGSLAAREAIVRNGLNYLDRLSSEGSGDPAVRRDLASAYLRIGAVQGSVLSSHKGDTSGALESFRKGLAALASSDSSKEAEMLRIDLRRAINQILNTRSAPEALRNIEEAMVIAARLHRQHPGDDEVARRLAGLYQAAALSARFGEQRPRALELGMQARDLFRQLIQRLPADRELRAEYAAVMSNAGSVQASLGRTVEARASLEEAVSHLEEICRLDPANNAHQRNRMLAYSHLGDLLGNPNYPNLGDTAGAIAAFRSMIGVAEIRYRSNPGDQGATIDYGMALGRTAALPLGSTAERLAMYQQSMGLLGEALKRDSANGSVAMNLASQKEETGDLLYAAGRMAEATGAWRESLDILTRTPVRLPAATRIIVTVCQKLGEHAARSGDAAQALAFAARAMQAVATIKETDAVPLRVNRARAYHVAGSIHALLGNAAEARKFTESALERFKALDGNPGFTNAHRRYYTAAETALAGLQKRAAR